MYKPLSLELAGLAGLSLLPLAAWETEETIRETGGTLPVWGTSKSTAVKNQQNAMCFHIILVETT